MTPSNRNKPLSTTTVSGAKSSRARSTAAGDAARRPQEGPCGEAGQGLVVEGRRAEEPLERDVDDAAEVEHSILHGRQGAGGEGVELRPREWVVGLPALTDAGATEAVGVDGRLHVTRAGGARHGRRLVRVGAVADLQSPAARQELDLGAPQTQGLGDHRFALHVGGPVARRDDEDAPPSALPRRCLPGQAAGLALLRRLGQLPQQQFGALACVLDRPVRAGKRHQGAAATGLRRRAPMSPARSSVPRTP